MGKRGRPPKMVAEVLLDGSEVINKPGYKSVTEGDKRIVTTEDGNEKVIIKFEKDSNLPLTCNGGWRMTSMETIIKKEVAQAESLEVKFEEPIDNESLPKTKRKYFNPANEKWVGYGRAVQLGLIK